MTQLDAGLDRLRRRRAVREGIEASTDAQQQPILDAVGDDYDELLVPPAGSSPHISTAQLPADQADDRPEYNQYEGRSSAWPAETCIHRYTQRTSGGGH